MESKYGDSDTVILKDWYFGPLNSTPFTPPEAIQYGFVGRAYNHPDYEDGAMIQVPSKGPAELTNKGTMITSLSGRKYLLQDVNEQYKEAYPDCEQRILGT